jgi:hypothetical protein
MKLPQDDRYCSDIPERVSPRIIGRHPNGVPSSEEYFFQGLLVGRRHWDPNGHPTLETPLQDGCKQGVEYSWYAAGALTLAEPYTAGLVHGTGIDLWRTSLAEGAIVLSEAFSMAHGRRHGFEWWLNDDQATVYEERHWTEGAQHGIERQWNLQGSLRSGYPLFFVAGEQVSVEAYQMASAEDPSFPLYRVGDDRPERDFPVEIITVMERVPAS